MARVLILCPTFDHTETLFASTASVRQQAFQDWELVVIGDGAPARTTEIMETIASEDPRIRYEPHPKSARYGEIYRDRVIRESRAEVVLQIGDDDLWAPDHIDSMIDLLGDSDWANEAPLRLGPDGTMEWWVIHHGTACMRSSILQGVPVSAGPNYVAYRRSTYLRLPEGWTCAPPSGPSDAYMWAKFFRLPGLSVASTARTTALKLPSHVKGRARLDSAQRLAELRPWLDRISEPGLLKGLCAQASIRSRMLALFQIHAVDKDGSWEGALRQCGFIPLGEHDRVAPARNGGPMALPLTTAQQLEAAAALEDFIGSR